MKTMKKPNMSRRRFLGGAGALLGLPLLSSLLPRVARGADPVLPKRFVGFYLPCGIVMNQWTPAETGAAWTSPILAPLDPFRDKVLVLSKLANLPGRSDGGGDHAAGTGAFLTAKHVKKTTGADIASDISIDQMLAPILSENRPFSSLELGTNPGSSVGDCDTGYSCAYATSIAWAGPETPLPKQTEPRAVFDRLFGGYDPDATATEIERRRRYRHSVLDYSLDEATSLRGELGKTDQHKLDEYMSSVRDLEVRIDIPVKVCRPGDRPDGDLDFPTRTRAMIDLMAIAFECDLTRVMTFMLGNAGSSNTYGHIGIAEGHHELSHHMDLAYNLDRLVQIDRWEIEQFAYMLGRFAAIDDGNGTTALDNSMIYLSSEISDGNAHNHNDMPVLLAGGGSGTLDTGVHRALPNVPVGNVFMSILEGLGAPVAKVGDDGTEPVPGLLKG